MQYRRHSEQITRRPKILFLSPSKPTTTKGFSGILYFTYQTLKHEFSPDTTYLSFGLLNMVAGAVNHIYRAIWGRRADFTWHPLFTYVAGRYATLMVSLHRPDAIVAVASAPYTAHLKSSAPIIYCSDATFSAIAKLYPAYSAFPAWQVRSAEYCENASLHNAAHIIYSSTWAKSSAVDDYKVDPSHISVLSFGPNIKIAYLPTKEVPLPSMDTCNLLHIGVDWERKGGNYTLAVHKILLDMGVPSRLHVVGRAPSKINNGIDVVVHGMLDKDLDEDMCKIADILRHSHFLVLPTQADATPVVFSEAAAFAVPTLTFDVGGTRDAVRSDVSGYIFPSHVPPTIFAEKIVSLWNDRQRYAELRRTTFGHFLAEANWQTWAASVAARVRLSIDTHHKSQHPPLVAPE